MKIVTETESDGWCSSCDQIGEMAVLDENGRQCCIVCGDFLIFADEEEEEQP